MKTVTPDTATDSSASNLDVARRFNDISSHATLLGLLAVTVVAAIVFVPNIVAGGFAMDDWIAIGQYLFHHGAGFWSQVTSSQVYPARAPMAVASMLEISALGTSSAHPYFVVDAITQLLESGILFIIARRLGVSAGPAALIAIIFLILPTADSTIFWLGEWGPSVFGRLLPLVGVLLAIEGLQRRRLISAAMEFGALVIYALAVYGYELAAPMVALAGVLYFWRAPWKKALLLWIADVLVVTAVLVLKPNYEAPTTSRAYLIAHAKLILGHGLDVITYSLIPRANEPVKIVVVISSAIILIAAIAAGVETLRMRRKSELGRWFSQYLAVAAIGLAVTGCGWLLIVPASFGYDPAASGVENRVNAISAIGIAVLVAGMAGLTLGLARLIFRQRWLTSATAVSLVMILVAVGDYLALQPDQTSWAQAATSRSLVLHTLHQLTPDPKPGTTIFTFGVVGYQSSDIPVFGGGGDDDLWWAVKVAYHRDNINGFPVFNVTPLVCGATSVTLAGTGFSSTTTYGFAEFVDIPERLVLSPQNAAACVKDSAKLQPFAGLVG